MRDYEITEFKELIKEYKLDIDTSKLLDGYKLKGDCLISRFRKDIEYYNNNGDTIIIQSFKNFIDNRICISFKRKDNSIGLSYIEISNNKIFHVCYGNNDRYYNNGKATELFYNWKGLVERIKFLDEDGMVSRLDGPAVFSENCGLTYCNYYIGGIPIERQLFEKLKQDSDSIFKNINRYKSPLKLFAIQEYAKKIGNSEIVDKINDKLLLMKLEGKWNGQPIRRYS